LSISADEYRSLIQSLNSTQRELHDFIYSWCWQFKQSPSKRPAPFHIFLSGSGGTGKSIKAIYHTVNKSFALAGSESSETHVILTVPTGTAAFNIDGTTVTVLGLSSRDRRKKVNETTVISTETGNHFLSQEKKTC
jgi:hypothetical protein